MSMEMDGAGACSGMLFPDDRILEVDGEPAESLQQVGVYSTRCSCASNLSGSVLSPCIHPSTVAAVSSLRTGDERFPRVSGHRARQGVVQGTVAVCFFAPLAA